MPAITAALCACCAPSPSGEELDRLGQVMLRGCAERSTAESNGARTVVSALLGMVHAARVHLTQCVS